jgi:hypothetical protein
MILMQPCRADTDKRQAQAAPDGTSAEESPVPRFKMADRILILPRFARLYPDDSGVVVAVKIDPFREKFNEYTVQFADGSTANIFEFQLVEAAV